MEENKVIIKNLEPDKINEFFEVFKNLVLTQFPEYSKNTRRFLYTNSKAINKKELRRKMKKDIVLSAFFNNIIVGILIADAPFGGVSFCHFAAVNPKFQLKGIGKYLLKNGKSRQKL